MPNTKYLKAKNGIEIDYGDGVTRILTGQFDPTTAGIAAEKGSIFIRTGDNKKLYIKTGINDNDWIYLVTSDDLTTISGGNGVSDFISLTDTPGTYTNNIGKYPRVNNSGDGLYFDYVIVYNSNPEVPLIPETAVSGTYFVNFEAGRLLIGGTGYIPDLVYIGPIGGLAFDEKNDEACYGSFKIPYSWHTETDIRTKLNFIVDSSQTGTKSCAWRIDFQAYKDGESYNDKSSTTVNLTTELPNNCQSGVFQTKQINLPYNDSNNPLERGDIVAFKLYREGTNINDTMAGDAVIIALMIEMTTGQHIIGDA